MRRLFEARLKPELMAPRAAQLVTRPQPRPGWLASHADKLHGTLLDLGCGNRPMSPWYEPLVDTVVAVDPAPGAGQNVQAMADLLPLRDNSIDVIFCTQALEHVEQIEQAPAGIARVLKPDGHVLITVPFLYPTHEAPYDFYRFTHIGLSKPMTRNGLEIVDAAAQGGPGVMLAS
jgi:SAM-dependent methyltransferase